MSQDESPGNESPETEQSPGTSAGVDDTSQENPVVAALCYIVGILVAVIVLATDMKKSRYMRFHAFHSLFLAVVVIVVWVIGFVLMILLAMMPGIRFFAPFILPLIGLAVLILCILLAVKAYNKEEVELPVITQMARDQADKMKV
jgi:uncharacterized membrane protein